MDQEDHTDVGKVHRHSYKRDSGNNTVDSNALPPRRSAFEKYPNFRTPMFLAPMMLAIMYLSQSVHWIVGIGFATPRNITVAASNDVIKSVSGSTAMTDSTELPPETVNQKVIINGISYSLDNPALFPFLPLPKPVLIVGMPKAGTSTLHSFFRKSGYRSSHYFCGSGKTISERFCGFCIREAIMNLQPPLQTCGNFDVWAQLDATYNPGLGLKECYFPQIFSMETIHVEASNATIILNRRDLNRWVESVRNWKNLHNRLKKCDGGPKSGSTEDLKEWHMNHISAIRDFVWRHPSHALVEVDIEDPTAGERMALLFQTNEKHWGHSNANPRNSSVPKTKAFGIGSP